MYHEKETIGRWQCRVHLGEVSKENGLWNCCGMPTVVPSQEFANASPVHVRVSRCAQLGCRRADHGIRADTIRANANATRFSMLQGYLQPPASPYYCPINVNAIYAHITSKSELERFFRSISTEGASRGTAAPDALPRCFGKWWHLQYCSPTIIATPLRIEQPLREPESMAPR
jgi:hypothetical protein